MSMSMNMDKAPACDALGACQASLFCRVGAPARQSCTVNARGCAELGVCQSRQPACPGYQGRPVKTRWQPGRFPFAPGVIQGGPRASRWLTDDRVEQLARAALALALLATLAATLYLCSGLEGAL